MSAPTDLLLGTRLDRLLGRATARALASLDLHTGEDLLRHHPRRYVPRGELTDLSALRPGDDVTVQARVLSADVRYPKPSGSSARRLRSILTVVVTDGSGRLSVTFFNSHWRAKSLLPGTEVVLAGKVERYRGALQLTNPEIEEPEEADELAGGLVPVYPASSAMSSLKIRRAVRVMLDSLPEELPDPVPAAVRRSGHLPGLAAAFRLSHRPGTWADVERARHRFRYEEALVLQTVLAQRRAATRALPARPRRPVAGGLLDAFDERLPFTLTAGQQRVGADLLGDLAREHPMHRLLQGEVGSGKTVVALRAMLTVVDAGGQCALLAPTEVLAQQHLRSITAMLGPLAEGGLLGGDDRGTRVVLLTGSQPTSARRAALLAAVSGDAGIVVGTHALLQDRVDFRDLGLVVVDEQHRFGVEQRDALRAKADSPPHVLVMTATPIPRTVAITVFGDLDVSTLEELPAGRSPIATHVVPADRPAWLDRTWSRVREEVDTGHRAYVVCPRIGDAGPAADEDVPDKDVPDEDVPDEDVPDEDVPDDGVADGGFPDEVASVGPGEGDAGGGALAPSASVVDVLAELRGRDELAGLTIEALHGRMTPEAKDSVMSRFAAGEVQVLVATTVIEVGVDVPAATVMVVLDADRFGISQLHQLRGRVGRGSAAGLCLLVSRAEEGTPARERVTAVAATLDGFELARLDLEQRREGDVLGAVQAGRRSSLRALSVVRDGDVIRAARDAATKLVERDPALRDEPALAAAVAALVDPDCEDHGADYLAKA